MATFAKKVKYGGGARFDLMLEEKGGWVAGEDPKQDEEMVEAMIEVLPTNLERNFSGLLVRKDAISFKVDPVKVNAHIALRKEHLLIAKFVGTKPTLQDMERWLQTLNQKKRKI